MDTATDVAEEVVNLQLLREDDAESCDESDLSDHEVSDLSEPDIEEIEIVELPSYSSDAIPSDISHVPCTDTIVHSPMEPTPTDEIPCEDSSEIEPLPPQLSPEDEGHADELTTLLLSTQLEEYSWIKSALTEDKIKEAVKIE
ncbi:hypothetical protein BGX26_003449 [Mortierella sp. AD094]|nr:hypothetical protein BGX26_003449 [Mortierella sp. AD094]